MTTITVSPEVNGASEVVYHAVTGDKQASGKTIGEAIDALTIRLDSAEKTKLTIEAEFPAPPAESEWKYLEARPHRWRKELYVKGHRLRASNVWWPVYVERMTMDEAADNWNLPLEAVHEAIRYCEGNRALLDAEAEEERCRLIEAGVILEPKPVA